MGRARGKEWARDLPKGRGAVQVRRGKRIQLLSPKKVCLLGRGGEERV